MTTQQNKQDSKEELRQILNHLGERCIMQEHYLTNTAKSEEVNKAIAHITRLIRQREQELLDEMEGEIIGEYETDKGADASRNATQGRHGRNQLRGLQRVALEAMRKERGL